MTPIEEKLKNLPARPGVYIMLDSDGNVIYVGKARYLKNRVRQYFHASSKRGEKVGAMVKRISDFQYIVTADEVEALMLESNLIKKHKPQYNILLKDDKAYPFIRINAADKYPRIEIVRAVKSDGAKYFGPYMAGVSAKDMTELIEGAFPLRNCKLSFEKTLKNKRPCLNYHINRCLAPCCMPAEEKYAEAVREVMKFLSGNDKAIHEILTGRMDAASRNEDYETALYYRDKLKLLDKIVRKQVAVLKKDYDLDVFAAAGNGMFSAVSLILVRGGKVVGEENAMSSDASLSEAEALGSLMRQYYARQPVNVSEIILSHELEEREEMQTVLSGAYGGSVRLICPKHGVRRQLVEMAGKNAAETLRVNELKAERMEEMTFGAVELLQNVLNLNRKPRRIEAYDISNISGQHKVSSMVVFIDGRAKNSDYRRFKIKTVEGSNDFASMNETLYRRLTRLKDGDTDASFGSRPDLLLIDGGRGQLSSAREALTALGMDDIEIISLAKREEEIYTLYSKDPVVLSKSNAGLNLLMRLRDEAHRFAISYFRKLKASKEFESRLTSVSGIGKAKAQSLYKHFKTLEKIRSASVEELTRCPGIGRKDAERLEEYFKDK